MPKSSPYVDLTSADCRADIGQTSSRYNYVYAFMIQFYNLNMTMRSLRKKRLLKQKRLPVLCRNADVLLTSGRRRYADVEIIPRCRRRADVGMPMPICRRLPDSCRRRTTSACSLGNNVNASIIMAAHQQKRFCPLSST